MRPKTSLYLFGSIGAVLGAALTGYIMSNSALRRELKKTATVTDALKTVARHLRKDGKELSTDMQDYLEESGAAEKWQRAKSALGNRFQDVKENTRENAKEGAREIRAAAKSR